jgi:hypothetical protein
VNKKPTEYRRFFAQGNGLTDLAECLDALGAPRGLDRPAVLHHGHPLQVGVERAVGGAFGMGDGTPEYNRFSTIIALRHFYSFPFTNNGRTYAPGEVTPGNGTIL